MTPRNDPWCVFSGACCCRGIFSHDRPAVCFIRKKKKRERDARWPCWSTPLVKFHNLYFKVGTSVKASNSIDANLGDKNFNTGILTNDPAQRHDRPATFSSSTSRCRLGKPVEQTIGANSFTSCSPEAVWTSAKAATAHGCFPSLTHPARCLLFDCYGNL